MSFPNTFRGDEQNVSTKQGSEKETLQFSSQVPEDITRVGIVQDKIEELTA